VGLQRRPAADADHLAVGIQLDPPFFGLDLQRRAGVAA
jgi:hypothetical protein